MFVDVELNDFSGIQVVEKIKTSNPCCVVIFVTSHIKYLDVAMDLKAIRFLHKPIDSEKVFSALEKAFSEINIGTIALFLKGNKYVRVKLSDIVYVETKMR